jgi:hypothetical protein
VVNAAKRTCGRFLSPHKGDLKKARVQCASRYHSSLLNLFPQFFRSLLPSALQLLGNLCKIPYRK